MLPRSWRLLAALPFFGAGACAHPPYPYPPPPPGPYEGAPEWYEPAASPRRIGVQVQPLTPDLRDYFGVEGNVGLLVASVEARSPASDAGIQAGDVLLEADRRALYEPDELVDVLQRAPEGAPVELLVLRKGRPLRMAITPRRDEPPGAPPPAAVSDPDLRERVRELELRVEELERQLARERSD